jgi:hypothetical protein
VTARESQIGHVGVEIMAAVGTVMLRIGEEEIVRPPGHKISHVVQKTFDAAQSVGSSATTRARAAFVVPAAFDDCGFGQIFDTSDSLGNVGQVFTGCRHGNVLQVRLSSPGYIGKFPSSTLEKLCIVATVS